MYLKMSLTIKYKEVKIFVLPDKSSDIEYIK